MTKHIIFTDYDLDGVGCYMCYLWCHDNNDDVKHRVIRVGISNLRDKILDFLRKDKFENYNSVYFFDLDCTEVSDLIDYKNVIIIDHHDSHIQNKDVYQNCKTVLKPYKSCAQLVYSIFSKYYSFIISKKRNTLIKLISDYDSYELKYPESIKLNYIIRFMDKGFENFIKYFYYGFEPFSNEQKRVYLFHLNKVEQIKSKIQLYKGNLKDYSVVFCFNDNYINEICDYALCETNYNICIMVSLTKKKVYFRRNKNFDKVKMGVLAEKLCNGGGHPEAAGGELTEKLLNTVKTFEEIKHNNME